MSIILQVVTEGIKTIFWQQKQTTDSLLQCNAAEKQMQV